MRVDSCTKEVKECLTSDDRCGADYTQCIGLDTDTIVKMCPYDKLLGCQQIYGDTEIRGQDVYDAIATMVEGIFLNIDNNMLAACQKAADAAMVKVCGDTANCDALTTDDNIGARSLEYKICEYKSNANSLDIDYSNCRPTIDNIQDTELGRVEFSTSGQLGPVTPFAGVLDGVIYWENVTFNEDGKLSSVDEYVAANQGALTQTQREKVQSELATLQTNINAAIEAIEADPQVQYCLTGRQVQGLDGRNIGDRDGKAGQNRARFPQLTKQMRLIIATSALKIAKDNYYKKYDELNQKMLQDYAKIGERMAEIKGENALDARRDMARQACISFAELSSLPKTPTPSSALGKLVGVVAMAGVVALGVVATPFTGGASLAVSAATVGAMGAGTAVAAAAMSSGTASNGADGGAKLDLVGSKQMNQWNYKEVITSTFEWETLNCRKCTRSQNCTKIGSPLFGSKYCKSWGDEVENCTDTQF